MDPKNKKLSKGDKKQGQETQKAFIKKLLAIPEEKRNPRVKFYLKYHHKPLLEILDMDAVLK